jgi:hypothetical protein
MKRVYWITMLVGLVFLGFPSAVNAGWTKTWGGSFSDYGNWVEQTSDGGYVITGLYEISPAPDRVNRVYLIKTDSLGDTLWTRSYGGEGYWGLNNQGRCVQETSDGGYVLIAEKGLPSLPWLFRFNADGDTLWTRTYEATRCYCVRE